MINGSYYRRRNRFSIFEPDEMKFGVSMTLLGRKYTNLVNDLGFLLTVKFHQNLFLQFQGRSKKYEKIKSDTDDGRCAMTISHLSLDPTMNINNMLLEDYSEINTFCPANMPLGNIFTCVLFLKRDGPIFSRTSLKLNRTNKCILLCLK